MEEEAGDEDDEDDDEDEDDDDDDESEGESAEAQPGAAEAKSAAAEPVVAEAHRAAVARCCCGGWSVLSATRSVSGLASGCCKWDCSACAFASNSAASARGCCSRCCSRGARTARSTRQWCLPTGGGGVCRQARRALLQEARLQRRPHPQRALRRGARAVRAVESAATTPHARRHQRRAQLVGVSGAAWAAARGVAARAPPR